MLRLRVWYRIWDVKVKGVGMRFPWSLGLGMKASGAPGSRTFSGG